jgi:uncharacterized protein (DUF1501 family)
MPPLTRRELLKTSALGMSAFFLPLASPRRARAAGSEPVLVTLFLRGGADPLTLVVPHGDPSYYALRPTLQVAPGTELDLDGFFGFHPALAPLLPLYQGQQLAVLHATGSSDPTRSHFDAQDFMETGAPGQKGVSNGWLNRALAEIGGGDPLAGVSLRNAATRSLGGPVPNVAFRSVAEFAVAGDFPAERRAALQALYAGIGDSLLGGSIGNAFAALDRVQTVAAALPGAVYPETDLGGALADAARLIKGDLGVKLIALDSGGWDHHADQLARIEPLASDLAGSLAAFHADLGADAGRTVVLVMTEFGRRVAQNGGDGSDHGHGGIMLALGGALSGGRVLLEDDRWPGLTPADLYRGEDLAVTTDFRDVLAEVLVRHLGLSARAAIFPGFGMDARRFPGLFG